MIVSRRSKDLVGDDHSDVDVTLLLLEARAVVNTRDKVSFHC